MKTATILCAFGTTKAAQVYDKLHQALQPLVGQEPLWAYSSRQITRSLNDKEDRPLTPEEALQLCQQKGYTGAVLQSLHLFPGEEFHRLVRVAGSSPLPVRLGLPLLTSEADMAELAGLIRPIYDQRQDALLILGHGTNHPTWTAYYSLEKVLRRHLGKELYVGVVEKQPNSDHLLGELVAQGHRQVTILPLFMVTGLHYRRDIVSSSKESWQQQLLAAGLEVSVIDQGLGELAGVERLISRHIEEARTELLGLSR